MRSLSTWALALFACTRAWASGPSYSVSLAPHRLACQSEAAPQLDNAQVVVTLNCPAEADIHEAVISFVDPADAQIAVEILKIADYRVELVNRSADLDLAGGTLDIAPTRTQIHADAKGVSLSLQKAVELVKNPPSKLYRARATLSEIPGLMGEIFGLLVNGTSDVIRRR